MEPSEQFGYVLLYVGLGLVVAGGWIVVAEPFRWFGRLPGDIVIERDHFTLYLPLASCLVVSAILSLLLYLIGRL